MKIIIGNDHAGVGLKNSIIEKFSDIEFVNVGCDTSDSVDYPDIANKLCEKVKDEKVFGILICGTGQGMAISANKIKGIRAGICYNELMAEFSRKHNNCNVLALGARVLGEELCFNIIKTFINTEFEGGRHQKRVEKILNLED